MHPDPEGSPVVPMRRWARHRHRAARVACLGVAGALVIGTLPMPVFASGNPPVAVDDAITVLEDSDFTNTNALANDTDDEGDTLTIASVTTPAHGESTLNGAHSLTRYAPDPDWNGTDTYDYVVDDGSGQDTGTITVTVTAVNDEPSFTKGADVMVAEDSGAYSAAWASAISAGPADESSQGVSFSVSDDNGALFSDRPDIDASGTLTFEPADDAHGSATVTVSMSDDGGTADGGDDTSATKTFAITVTSVNDAPSTAPDGYSVDEDGTLAPAGSVLDNDTDVEGDPMTAWLDDDVDHGALLLDPDGTFSYWPAPDWNGTDTFAYVADDGTDAAAPETVTITVAPVNDAPSFTAGADVTVDEDSGAYSAAWASAISAGPADESGQTVSFSVSADKPWLFSTQPAIDASGTLTFTPADDEYGIAGVIVSMSDDGGTARGGDDTSLPEFLQIWVTGVNDTPVAADDAYSTDEDVTLMVDAPGVLANDTDADGDTLAASLATWPAHGMLALHPDGSFDYTPEPDWSGIDSFTYLANDGTDDSVPATVTITVTPVNDAPVAADDAYTVDEDDFLTVAAGVLSNDTDAEGDMLAATLVTGTSHGAVALAFDGSFDYAPAPDFFGTDSFTYTAGDETDVSAPATVTITVDPVDDAPVAADDAYSTDEDVTLAVDAPGVLSNDTDADGDTLSAALVTDVAHGTLVLGPDGSFDYTPAADFSGTDTFTYKAADGTDESSLVTVTITVDPVNDAPVADDDAWSVDEDDTLTVAAPGVLGNDTDVDGDPLTAMLFIGPSHGTLSLGPDGSFDYTPNPDFFGTDSFIYTANDGNDDSASAVVIITVDPTPDPVTAVDDAFSVLQDTGAFVPLSVLVNDANPDGSPIHVSSVGFAAHGEVILPFGGGLVRYMPDAGYVGPDSFTYVMTDGSTSDTATVNVTVVDVNEAPSFSAGPDVTVDEDSGAYSAAWASAISAGPASESGQDVTFSVSADDATLFSAQPAIDASGTLTFTPAADAHGVATVSVTAHDDGGTADGGVDASATQTFTITVDPVNDAPVAADDAYTVDEDDTLAVAAPGVLGNDTDAEGDALAAALVDDVAHGTLTLDADGGLTYAPDADWNGTDTFTYLAGDGADSDLATVTITVTPVNDAPVAADDAYSTPEDVTLAVAAPGVLSNDTDADGDMLSATVVTWPAHGVLAPGPNGSFHYTPYPDWSGTDSFAYTAGDGTDISARATVTITVTPVNDAPVAGDDAFATDEDDTLAVDAPGVLGNDTDADGDPLAASLVTDVAHGMLSLHPDGSFDYTPEPDWSGTDSFTYKAADGTDESSPVTVTITVDPVNDAPVAADDAFSVDEDDSLLTSPMSVLSNDTDAEGDTLTIASVTDDADHGSLSVDLVTGQFAYTPDADFSGTDTFAYAATDGTDVSAPATVTITVDPVDDAPVAADDAYSTPEDVTLTVDAPGVLSNDTDADGDPLSASLMDDVAHGTLTLDADGGLTYAPDADWSGTDTFTYLANDGTDDSVPATVTITVTPVNDSPVAADDAYSTDEDVTLEVAAPGVLGNDTDPEGTVLGMGLYSTTTHGTLSSDGDGGFVYTPHPDFNGTDSFTYQAGDGTATTLATVTITVDPVNDAPVAADDAASVLNGAVTSVDVLANDVDVDDALSYDDVTITEQPGHGAASVDADTGRIVVTPDGYHSTDSLTYQVCDADAACDSAVLTLIGIDTASPVMDAVEVSLTTGTIPSDGKRARLKVARTAQDAGSGVAGYEVQMRQSGASSWTTITGTTFVAPLGRDITVRARATDTEGNVSAWRTAPTYRAGIVDDRARVVDKRGSWRRVAEGHSIADTLSTSKAKGASATVRAYGRDVVLIARTTPGAGKLRIYVDGSLVGTVSLSGRNGYRQGVWHGHWPTAKRRTIKVVVDKGSKGWSASIDAFVTGR